MSAAKSKNIQVSCTKKICLNCDHFDHYFTPNRGNVVAWHPTDRGRCRGTERELNAYRKACKQFEFVKPR